MTMKTINCLDCGDSYSYNENAGFPRKYCPFCSAKRKASFEGQTGQTAPPEIANEGVAEAVKANVERTYKAPSDKFTTMYVSYAKDIFCEMLKISENTTNEAVMEASITLVKQAQKAFE